MSEKNYDNYCCAAGDLDKVHDCIRYDKNITPKRVDPIGETLKEKDAKISNLEEENEKLKGILSSDPECKASKEEREMWRLSAVRSADKLQKDLKEALEALEFTFFLTPTPCEELRNDIYQRAYKQAKEALKKIKEVLK